MKLALITGASSGVGAATARLFAQNGIKVGMVARRQEILDQLASEIGENAVPLACDVSDAGAVDTMAAEVTDKHGAPDIVVNCAGLGEWKRLEDTEPANAVAMIGAPYLSAFFVTRAFLPGMLARNSGTVIHVNSPASYVAWPSSVGYTASRAALRGFHEALAQDLVKTGVDSCHIVFGKIDSAYFEVNDVPEDAIPAISKTMPTLTPEYCAQRILEVARRPRYLLIAPLMLRLQIAFSRYFPRMTRWLVRF
ncbi:MAG: SDR family NAD(P)-dependent oxidoreductase [Pseudomonadota bacterium]